MTMLSPGRTYSFVVLILILLTTSSLAVPQNNVPLSTVDQIKSEFEMVPCKNQDRLNSAEALFEKMGAQKSDISVEKYKNVDNLVVRKQGRSNELIVVGAHYDKVTDGCGAIDNWTGIVAIAHLYRSLKNVALKKTILFVAFGQEEKGLVGSHAMAAAIKKEGIENYCEMINIDSLGMATPQVLDNVSSKKLEALVSDTAKDLKLPFSHASVAVADADSSSFMARRIPAVTIHGLNNDWMKIIHSGNDQASKVNPVSVYLGYRLILSMITRLDSSSCSAYR